MSRIDKMCVVPDGCVTVDVGALHTEEARREWFDWLTPMYAPVRVITGNLYWIAPDVYRELFARLRSSRIPANALTDGEACVYALSRFADDFFLVELDANAVGLQVFKYATDSIGDVQVRVLDAFGVKTEWIEPDAVWRSIRHPD